MPKAWLSLAVFITLLCFGETRLFDSQKSTTFVTQLGEPVVQRLRDTVFVGLIAEDLVTVMTPNRASFHTVTLANHWKDADGILGLSIGDTELLELESGADTRGILASLMYNRSRMMALSLDRTGGTLAVGDLTPLLQHSNSGVVDVEKHCSGAMCVFDGWRIPISAMRVGKQPHFINASEAKLTGVLDSRSECIEMPTSGALGNVYDRFFKAFGSPSQMSATIPSLFFTIGGTDFEVPFTDLAPSWDKWCVNPVQSQPFIRLGQAFLRNVVSVYNADNPKAPQVGLLSKTLGSTKLSAMAHVSKLELSFNATQSKGYKATIAVGTPPQRNFEIVVDTSAHGLSIMTIPFNPKPNARQFGGLWVVLLISAFLLYKLWWKPRTTGRPLGSTARHTRPLSPDRRPPTWGSGNRLGR